MTKIIDTIAAPAPAGLDISSYIDVDAWFDRWGALRWLVLADQDAMVQAFISDARSRPYLDLNRADIRQALDQLDVRNYPGYDAAFKQTLLRVPVAAADQRILKKLYF